MPTSIKTDAVVDPLLDPLVALRATVAAIQQQNRERGHPISAVSGQTASDWLEHALGLFEGSASFEEAVRYGKKWRETSRSPTSGE